jgi:hypothetical protein
MVMQFVLKKNLAKNMFWKVFWARLKYFIVPITDVRTVALEPDEILS